MSSTQTTPQTRGVVAPASPPTQRAAKENGKRIRLMIAAGILGAGVILALLDGLNINWVLGAALLGLLVWHPVHGILVIYSIISVYPAIRVFSVSIRPTTSLLSRSLAVIPENASFGNYIELLQEENFLLWLWNSLSVTVSVSIVGVIVAATGAYAFSRWRFPARRPLLIFLLTTQMIPAGLLVLPIFVIVAQLGLRNQVLGLMLAYIVTAVPFSIWILKGYYDTIPPDLEEAAMVDGANRIEAFIRVILPLATPALSIVFLFNFLTAWSEYIVANVILQAETSLTWPLGLQDLIIQFNTDWGKYAAGALIVTLPVLILFISQSRYLISGLTIGSVKG